MKRNGEKKAARVSKMSLAARKAWETRRKRYGYVKKPSSEDEPEIVVEQLKRGYRGYRKGHLVLKGKRAARKGRAVKMDDKLREYLDFLYGRRWFEEVVLRKLWSQARELAEREIWKGDKADIASALFS